MAIYYYDLSIRNYEIIWIKIQPTTGRDVIIGAVYHPPKPIYEEGAFIDDLEGRIDHLSEQSPEAQIVLAGDFNTIDLELIMIRTGLINIVHEPTRGDSCLDRILVSENNYDHVRVVRPAGNSDHQAILAYSGSPSICHKKDRRIIQYRKKSPGQNAAFLAFIAAAGPVGVPTDANGGVQESFDNFY